MKVLIVLPKCFPKTTSGRRCFGILGVSRLNALCNSKPLRFITRSFFRGPRVSFSNERPKSFPESFSFSVSLSLSVSVGTTFLFFEMSNFPDIFGDIGRKRDGTAMKEWLLVFIKKDVTLAIKQLIVFHDSCLGNWACFRVDTSVSVCTHLGNLIILPQMVH